MKDERAILFQDVRLAGRGERADVLVRGGASRPSAMRTPKRTRM